MRSTDFVSEYRAAGKVSVAGTIKLGNQFKDTYQVVNTPISHLYEVRIDDSPRETYPSYYFYNKDTGACVGSFSINAMPDAADDASPIVRPGVQIVQPHMTLAPEVQGKGLGSLIYDTFLAGGNWLFATFDHSSGAGALWDRMATKGSNISVLYNFNSDTVVEPGTKQAQTAVRILGPKERFKNKQGVEEELAEGWKDWVAGGALALGAMGAQANSIVSQLVEPGDTVYSIARQNNVHPSVLYKLNGFNNNTKLTPGQEVKVPDVYTQTAKPAAKAPTAKPAIAQGVRGAVARANALRPVAKAQPKAAPAAKTVAPITGSKAEQLLMNTAVRSGITGTELAAFMAQMAHESDDFKSMKEYGGSLDFRKYDPKYAPKKAKTLGNKYAGDGNRFKGRGFIQITGRYNYRIAGKAIGIDLVKNPKLAEDPAVAAKIAVWYWKLRVQPNVTNWNDVEAVTKPINPGMRGLEDRKENFADYLTAMATVDKAV